MWHDTIGISLWLWENQTVQEDVGGEKHDLIENFVLGLDNNPQVFENAVTFFQTDINNGLETESLVQTRISMSQKQKK